MTFVVKRSKESLQRVFVAVVVVFALSCFISILLTQKFLRPILRREKIADGQNSEVLYFIAMGDYGREGLYNQREVAHMMGEWCKNRAVQNNGKCHFIVTTGDNFYEDGVRNEFDRQFLTSFENIYTHSALQETRFYQILGNHDYHLNPEAQIQYSQTRNTKFYIPKHFYSSIEKTDQVSIQFVFADTCPFIEYYFSTSKEKFNRTALNMARSHTNEQLKFLNDELSKYTLPKFASHHDDDTDHIVDYKILVGHHPAYSAELYHGDVEEMKRIFNPIMYKNGVFMYLSGHSHVLQYVRNSAESEHLDVIQQEKGQYSVVHMISGAGSKPRGINPKYPNLLAYQEDSGFQFIEARKQYMKIWFVNYMGEVKYETIIQNPFQKSEQ